MTRDHERRPRDEDREQQRERGRPVPADHAEPAIGEDEHGEPPGPGDAESGTHRPPVGLDDPAVPAVPETTPDPGDTEGEAAARIARDASGEQDAWGEPEDRPDHDGNEAYAQRRRGSRSE